MKLDKKIEKHNDLQNVDYSQEYLIGNKQFLNRIELKRYNDAKRLRNEKEIQLKAV